MQLRHFTIITIAAAFVLALGAFPNSAFAQVTDAAPTQTDSAPEEPVADPPVQTEPEPEPQPVREFPSDPNTRLSMARHAFNTAEFDLLRPLLEPLLNPQSLLDELLDRQEARQLLALGLFFEAQQTHDAPQRRNLLKSVRGYFLNILREQPDYTLDPLVYPASIVEIFENVREENREELHSIRAAQNAESYTDNAPDLQMLYIEREVQNNHYALNFFPFGVGQFQNNSPVKGTLFAVSQGLALAINITSYLMIEYLRGPDGRYETSSSAQGGNYAEALAWQRAQYGALAAFAALYTWSILDGILNFNATQIRIRTLDSPPSELNVPSLNTGNETGLTLGWSINWRW